jgi:hypothetical protein
MISSSLVPFFLKAVYENPYSDKKILRGVYLLTKK